MALLNRHLIIGLSFLILCGTALRAADGPTAVVPIARQIEVSFSVFGTREFKNLAYLSSTSAKPNTVKFYSVTLSAAYAYKGDPQLKFYDATELGAALEAVAVARKANPQGPEPALALKPIAVCKIPDGVKKAVLLFFPRAGSDTQCDIFPMDMNVTKVPPGNLVIINASGRDFVGQVNSKIVPINRGVSEPFNAEKGKISIKMARTEPQFQNVVCSDRWALRKNERRLWVLFPLTNPMDVLPDARCLLEKVPAEERQDMQSVAVANVE